ncbi:MAG: RidA family protein [Actinomycetes bacterium]
MTSDKLISSGGPWEAKIGYSRAVVAGDHVHVSGSTATVDGQLQHPGDAYGQTKVAFEVVAKALGQVGVGLVDVIRTRMYVTSTDALDDVGRAHGELFGEIRPASTMVVIAALVNPEMLVEVEADAYQVGLGERLRNS